MKPVKAIVFFGVLCTSFSAIFVKYSDAPSSVLAMYRMLFAALILLPVILLKNRQELVRLPRKSIAESAFSGLFLACHFTSYFESLKFTSVASSTVLTDMDVILIALVTIFVFRDRLSRLSLIGIAVTFLGSLILAMGDSSGAGGALSGDLLAFLAAVCMAGYTLLGQRQRAVMSTNVYTFLVYGTAAAALILFNLISGTALWGYALKNIILALGLTVVCTLMGHSVFSWALKYEKPVFISTARLMEPVFASLLAFFLFAQIPGWLQLAGIVCVLGGIFIYLRADFRRTKEEKT